MKAPRTWIRIAHCRDIPLREGRAVHAGKREVAVFNLGDRFLAVENRCPHKAGPLADGIVSGTTVVCPLHAWKLSLETGRGVAGPSASSCVETFRTRVEDGAVFLEMPAEWAETEATEAEAATGDFAVACLSHGLDNTASESRPAEN
jgi:nitrite reductase (NADH) small subunit